MGFSRRIEHVALRDIICNAIVADSEIADFVNSVTSPLDTTTNAKGDSWNSEILVAQLDRRNYSLTVDERY